MSWTAKQSEGMQILFVLQNRQLRHITRFSHYAVSSLNGDGSDFSFSMDGHLMEFESKTGME